MTFEGGQQIGKITKYFSGMLQEMMTAADTFGVEFPPDLDVKLKATLIYATFLIVSTQIPPPFRYEFIQTKRMMFA